MPGYAFGGGEASMASEPEDLHARQLEALRRYMAHLGTEGDQPGTGTGTHPDRRRPPLPWLLLTALLVAVALVGGVLVGAVAWSDDRPAGGDAGTGASASRASATATATASPVATLACKTAVDRANAMLASAVKLREDFAAQDQTLREAANRDLSAAQLLQRLAPLRQAGAGEASRFDRELDAYRQIIDQCDVRAP
jgi:hypothetical protein